MSHFNVLVAAKDEEGLRKNLLPYHEYECTRIMDYTIWLDDIHDDGLNEYKTGSVDCVFKDGVLIGSIYSDRQEIEAMWKRAGIGIGSNDEFVLHDGYELRNTPFTELYKTFAEFMKDWMGHDESDIGPDGRYGRRTNPNKKWDSYTVGGQWAGKLLAKIPTNDTQEQHRAMVDFCKSGMIDWDFMLQKRIMEKTTRFDDYHALLANIASDHVSLDDIEEYSPGYSELLSRKVGFEKLFPDIHSYIRHKKHQHEFIDTIGFLGVNEELQYHADREEFIANIDTSLTWAFIDHDGSWVEKGEMEWFGCYSSDESHEGYAARFWEFVRSIPDDDNVYMVDCHI